MEGWGEGICGVEERSAVNRCSCPAKEESGTEEEIVSTELARKSSMDRFAPCQTAPQRGKGNHGNTPRKLLVDGTVHLDNTAYETVDECGSTTTLPRLPVVAEWKANPSTLGALSGLQFLRSHTWSLGLADCREMIILPRDV